MIQRIQSVYLLLVAALMAVMFFLSLSKENIVESYYSVFFAISGITALFAVFLFKNRKLQMKITWIPVLISFGLFFSFIFSLLKNMNFDSEPVYIVFFMLTPLIAAVLALGALLAIRKDEKLVRSLDRLR
jgi:peptidoglycan/LPS O-acetylase OafA/YrhL